MSDKRVIWKFPLESILTYIEMPDGAEVVGFGHQDGQLVLWARVCPEAGMVHRSFRVAATGEGHDAGLTHCGLVQMPNGLVWHLLEDRKAEAGQAERPAVCDHEPTPDIAEAVARHAAAGQITSARKLLHDNSRLTWEEVVARVDGLSGKAGAR